MRRQLRPRGARRFHRPMRYLRRPHPLTAFDALLASAPEMTSDQIRTVLDMLASRLRVTSARHN